METPTFHVQPVEHGGKTESYVVSGLVNETQLTELRRLVDSANYKRSKRWRGQYQELAKSIVEAIDEVFDIEA